MQNFLSISVEWRYQKPVLWRLSSGSKCLVVAEAKNAQAHISIEIQTNWICECSFLVIYPHAISSFLMLTPTHAMHVQFARGSITGIQSSWHIFPNCRNLIISLTLLGLVWFGFGVCRLDCNELQNNCTHMVYGDAYMHIVVVLLYLLHARTNVLQFDVCMCQWMCTVCPYKCLICWTMMSVFIAN